MLNGNDNVNGFKTNRSNKQKKKTKCTCSTLFLLISKKQICMCSRLFCLSLAVVLHNFNTVLYEQNVKPPSYTLFFGSLYVLTQYFVSCVPGCFYFSLPLIFTLLVASISHFLTAALNFHVFLSTKFVSLVSITCSSFFSFIDVNIEDNTEKDTTLMLLFLSKSPGGRVISFQIKP